MKAARNLEAEYFGTDQPNVTGPNCNVCGVDIGPWHGKKERHIAFHESQRPFTTPTSEPTWTMTESEFYRELAKAWQEGFGAPDDEPENPYLKERP